MKTFPHGPVLLRRCAGPALALVALLVPEAGAAQDAAALEVGSRIRLTAPEHGLDRRKGFVRELDPRGDSLAVRPDGAGQDVLRLAWSDVTELEVAVEGRSRAGAGLVLGLLGGAAVGFGIGLAEGDDPPNTGFFKGPTFSGTEKGAIYGVALGALGAFAGHRIGAALSDRWETLDTRGFGVTVSPTPGPGGVGLGIVLVAPARRR